MVGWLSDEGLKTVMRAGLKRLKTLLESSEGTSAKTANMYVIHMNLCPICRGSGTVRHNIERSMPPTILIPGSSSAKYFSPSSTRREVLSLYREILRTCKVFHWCDNNGEPWSIRLKQEAKKEFLSAKEERDPLIIARLLVTGRDCVQNIQKKFNDADRAARSRIERDSQNRDSSQRKGY